MAATDYDFQSTRTEIIKSALRKIGAIELGERLSADAEVTAVQALNEIVKSWQRRHVFLWSYNAQSIPLVSGTQRYIPYTLTNSPIVYIEKAYFRDSSGTDTPLRVISYSQFQDIWDKDDAGDPTLIAYNPADGYLYTYPTCNASSQSLLLWNVVKLKDWDTVAGSGDFPVQFEDALIYALAAELAPEYGLPISERREMRQEAEVRFREAKNFDRERTDLDFVEGAF